LQVGKCANVLGGITVDGQVAWNIIELGVGRGGGRRFTDMLNIESLDMLWPLHGKHFGDVELIKLTGKHAEFRGAPIHGVSEETFFGDYFRLGRAFNDVKELHFIWKNWQLRQKRLSVLLELNERRQTGEQGKD